MKSGVKLSGIGYCRVLLSSALSTVFKILNSRVQSNCQIYPLPKSIWNASRILHGCRATHLFGLSRLYPAEVRKHFSGKDSHNIRTGSVQSTNSRFDKLQKNVEDLTRQFRSLKKHKGIKNEKIGCWTCGKENHIRKKCPKRRRTGDKMPH